MTPIRAVLCSLLIVVFCASAEAQDVRVRPVMAYRATVTDPVIIGQLLHQQSIPAEGTVDSIEIVDAMADGFGGNDLVVLYPSKQVFVLMAVEEPLKTVMDNWHYNLQQRTTPNTTSRELADQARSERSPFAGLLSHIMRGLEAYYSGTVIEGAFRRDESTAFLALWNFVPDSFKYREQGTAGASDTLRYYDLLQIVSRDTTYVADSTIYDVIYVYKTYHDTVYVPASQNASAGSHDK
jgi:hypothetical protein